jgi:hypothetical protein
MGDLGVPPARTGHVGHSPITPSRNGQQAGVLDAAAALREMPPVAVGG